MDMLQTLRRLRDDIKSWVANNLKALNAKIDEKTFPIDSKLNSTSTNPVQNKVITEALNNVPRFSGDYNDLTNAPNITEDDSGNMVIADEAGNVIFKADADGIHTTAVSINGATAATEDYVDEAVANIDIPEADFTNYTTEEFVSQSIETAKTEISESITSESSDWKIVDNEGNIILSVDAEGTHTTSLTLKGENAATEKYVDDAIDAIEVPEVDLSDHYTKEETDLAIDTLKADISEQIVSESDEWTVADNKGNLIFKVDSDGIHTTSLTLDGEDIHSIIGNRTNSNGGSGGSVAIVNAIESSEMKDKDVFYRQTSSAMFVDHNNNNINSYSCICVHALPSIPVPVTSDMEQFTFYYTIEDQDVYGYVSEELATMFGVPTGWYDALSIFGVLNVSYEGIKFHRTTCSVGWIYLYIQEGINVISGVGVQELTNKPGKISIGIGSEVFNYETGNIAKGDYSHAEGFMTSAYGKHQHVQGRYNVSDTINKYAHIVGNGVDKFHSSNAHTLDWNGVGWFQGGLKVGGTGQDDPDAKQVALVDPDAVVFKKITFADRPSLVSWLDENYSKVIRADVQIASMGVGLNCQCGRWQYDSGYIVNYSLYQTRWNIAYEYDEMVSTTIVITDVETTYSVQARIQIYGDNTEPLGKRLSEPATIPDTYWSNMGISVTILYYE